MKITRTMAVLIRAGVPALLIAAALSGRGRISVYIWMAAAAVWVAGMLVRDFIVAASAEPARLLLPWQPYGRWRRGYAVSRPSDLHTISGLLIEAQSSARVHANRLRPRLVALAEHFLPVRHGLVLGDDRGQLSALLGDVAWLIDPTVNDRTVTPADVERFLEVIMADAAEATPPHRWQRRVPAS